MNNAAPSMRGSSITRPGCLRYAKATFIIAKLPKEFGQKSQILGFSFFSSPTHQKSLFLHTLCQLCIHKITKSIEEIIIMLKNYDQDVKNSTKRNNMFMVMHSYHGIWIMETISENP